MSDFNINMVEKILTIAIPTYNRIELLKKNIGYVIEQLTSECKFLIIDNSSDYDIRYELSSVLNLYPDIDIEIVINSTNIGGNSNVMKCFELCKTDWLYIIGDDDKLLDGSIILFIEDIKRHYDYFNINYKWNSTQKWASHRPKSCFGIDSFIVDIESISQVLFISSNLYHVSYLRNFILFGYLFQLSNAPHIALLIMALNENESSKVFLSDQFIVNNGYEEVPDRLKWSELSLYRDIRLLLDLPLSDKVKKLIFYKLKKSFTMKMLMNCLILEYERNHSRTLLFENFRKATSYISIYEKSIIQRIFFSLIKLTLYFPYILVNVHKLAFLIKSHRHN
jgi:abequosyltransferase